MARTNPDPLEAFSPPYNRGKLRRNAHYDHDRSPEGRRSSPPAQHDLPAVLETPKAEGRERNPPGGAVTRGQLAPWADELQHRTRKPCTVATVGRSPAAPKPRAPAAGYLQAATIG